MRKKAARRSDLAQDHSTRTFEEIQSEAGINPELHEKNTDRLRPGDRIRIIAINRATGYMGTTDTTLQEGGSNSGGNLGFPIDDMVMGPPNLRIEVTRDYNVQAGLNAGDLREDQIVGFEGASLSSDKFVAVHTEWLDHQGRPIPEALDGAGYTGRLATLAGDQKLPSGTPSSVVRLFDSYLGLLRRTSWRPQTVIRAGAQRGCGSVCTLIYRGEGRQPGRAAQTAAVAP